MSRKTKTKFRTNHRLKADPARQTPNNSYSPLLSYEDISFQCRDCGEPCVWTAEQQRLWYEQWGGPIQSTAVRCRACRQRLRREKLEQQQRMQQMAVKKGAKKRD